MSALADEFPDQDQRAAVCFDAFRKGLKLRSIDLSDLETRGELRSAILDGMPAIFRHSGEQAVIEQHGLLQWRMTNGQTTIGRASQVASLLAARWSKSGMPTDEIKFTIDQIRQWCPSCANYMKASGIDEITLEDLKRFAKQDANLVCADIWLNGPDGQRESFSGGTQGVRRQDTPPPRWWADCLLRIGT
jgi:hypothetical protein